MTYDVSLATGTLTSAAHMYCTMLADCCVYVNIEQISNRGSLALPVSHTCFFSVELPDFKTVEEMRRGLLTAIHFGACGILNA